MRTTKIIQQINELNSELEKLRPEFERLWNEILNVRADSRSIRQRTMEDMIEEILETNLMPVSNLANNFSRKFFPSLFEDDGSRVFRFPHTKRTLQPYLKWAFQILIHYMKTENTRHPSFLLHVWRRYSELAILTRIHSILKEKKLLRGQDIDHQKFIFEAFRNMISTYRIVEPIADFENKPELERMMYKKGYADLLYHENRIRVIRINDVKASIYFGQQTKPKWCISTTNKTRNKFDVFDNDYNIYFLFDENRKLKFALIIERDGSHMEVWDNENKEMDIDHFMLSYGTIFDDLNLIGDESEDWIDNDD